MIELEGTMKQFKETYRGQLIYENKKNKITVDFQNNKSVLTIKNELGEGILIFCLRAVGRTCSGRSFGKIIIIILSFKVGISKYKNINHRVKETCAIMPTQVTYETDHISLLCDSTMSSASNFCFFMYFIVI